MPKSNTLMTAVGKERMLRLLELAKERTKKEGKSSALSKRYIRIAREISSHYKIAAPKQFKNSVCNRCNNALVPGINCKVRLSSNKYVVYKCECGKEKHVFYK